MSICSNSVRAISRSRSSQTKTLLPFLYQTPTIQQWQPATQSIARRNIYTPSRPYVREDIPFENEADLPPPIDRAPSHKTTITRTERAAFQKLYRKVDAEGRQQKKKDHAVELDQVADEHYKDEKDNTKPSLDKVFDEALKGQPRLRALRTERTKARSTKEDVAKLKEMGLAERERIDKLIRNAPTDRALWQTLEREVFTKVRDLDLDNASGGPPKASTSKPSSDTLKKASKAKPPLDRRTHLLPQLPLPPHNGHCHPPHRVPLFNPTLLHPAHDQEARPLLPRSRRHNNAIQTPHPHSMDPAMLLHHHQHAPRRNGQQRH
jgi:hypothetical protein